VFRYEGEGMFWHNVRLTLLAGVVVAATPAARAGDCCNPCAPAPAMRTVSVKEWVPEQYTTTRTSYRTEWREEAFTAYRCECTPEVRSRTVTVCRMVPEVKDVVRRVCVTVPVCEDRTVMKPHWTCKPVTCTVRRCVDHGHWECREVPCEPSCCERVKKWFKRKKDCCDSCCEPCCPPPTKTVKVWVPCKVWEEVPVTRMVRTCEYVPTVVKVTTCRQEWREERCQVTVCRAVPETRVENCTVLVKRMVPYQATRKVAVCVPCTENVVCTRMVCRTVEKQVACCEPTCEPCCNSCGGKRKFFGAGLSHRHGCCD
jgi:hypothetical protein